MEALVDSPLIYLVAILAGALAGFINTLAGSGSLIALPMLIFLGLPATVANGTNRVGVLFQNIVGVLKFKKSGMLDTQSGGFLAPPLILGAMVGALIAVDLDEGTMRMAISGVMLLMLAVILFKPKDWLKRESKLRADFKSVTTFVIFFVVGVYGGFVQAGVGVFLLAAMVPWCGFNLVHANALKLVLVLVFTLPALVIFAWNNQIHWGFGLLMAVGQSAGAWIAAHFAANSPNAAIWIRRLLIAVIVFSVLKLTGLLNWAF